MSNKQTTRIDNIYSLESNDVDGSKKNQRDDRIDD